MRKQSKQSKAESKHETKLDIFLVFFQLFGMIILPAIYLVTPLFNFADYKLPVWMGLLGMAIFIAGLWLLWKSHADLGKNWSPELRIREEHSLVTNGVYRYIRHPMYGAHWVWGIAQVFILQNWIVGPATLITFAPFYFYRIPHEEQMMLEQFGESYTNYIKKTGRVIPSLLKAIKTS
jgi:protein-S-isoprenylcysteine O-methyltransferase Ste14